MPHPSRPHHHRGGGDGDDLELRFAGGRVWVLVVAGSVAGACGAAGRVRVAIAVAILVAWSAVTLGSAC